MAKSSGHSKPGPKINTVKAKEDFLCGYIEGGTLAYAAEAADVSRDIHYYWMKTDPEYKEAFWHAQETSVDELESVARKRAIEGSDGLLKFLLEGRRSAIFKRRAELTGAGGGPLLITQIERVIVDPAESGGDEEV